MRKFVHSYLSSFFIIKKISFDKETKLFGFDVICIKDSDDIIYGDRLMKELVLAAYVDEVTLKRFVNEWVKLNYPNADLEVYWKREEPNNKNLTIFNPPSGNAFIVEMAQMIRDRVNQMQDELEHPDLPMALPLAISSRKRKKKNLDN